MSNQKNLKFVKKALGAVLLGTIVGIFFGPQAAILKPIGDIYIMLLQAVVFPYLICSIIHGLASTSADVTRVLLNRSWFIYFGLIAFVIFLLVLLAKAIPQPESLLILTQSKFVNPLPELEKLLVPANLFSALSLNYVPAVILFSVMFGFMVQHVPKKQSFINILHTISQTSLKFWQWLVKFAPIALFTLIAYLAGTIRISLLFSMGLYLIFFALSSLLLALWSLPNILCSIVPIRYKELMREMYAPLLVAVITTLSVTSLPYIQAYINKLLHRLHAGKEEKEIVETSIAMSYPFVQLGNLYIYLFIIFALVYFQHPLLSTQHWLLPIISFFSSLGSPTASVNSVKFLATWLQLPAPTTDLYVELMTITRYFQVTLSVMGISFMAIAMSLAYYKKLKIRFGALLFHIVTTILIFYVITALSHQIERYPQSGFQYQNFTLPQALIERVKMTVIPFSQVDRVPGDSQDREDAFLRVNRARILRVGYNPKVVPYAYFNHEGQLVGYDIAYACALADALDVKIIFVPFHWNNLLDDLLQNKFDLALSSVFLTPRGMRNMLYTAPLIYTSLALVIAKHEQRHFVSIKTMLAAHKSRIAVWNVLQINTWIKKYFSQASIIKINNYDTGIKLLRDKKIDALLIPRYEGRALASLNPGLVVVVPKDLRHKIAISYMLAPQSKGLLQFINNWLLLARHDGLDQKLFNHWILGYPDPQEKKARWSVLGNLLSS